MLNLVYKEFVQLRTYLLQIVGFMALAVIIFGKTSPSFAMSYIYVLPVVLSMTLPQIIFGQEERGNTFVFLRALPIRPSEIVAAKYLVSVAVTAAFLGIIGLASVAGILPAEGVIPAVAVVGFVSLILAGLSFFLHFWLGPKSAKVALILVTFTLAIPIMLASRDPGVFEAKLVARYAWVQPLAASPLGACLAVGAGLLVFAVSYAGSAWIFTKRDLSRLP